MEVVVRTQAGRLKLDANVLDVARFLASVRGYNLDIEPMEPGRAKLTATHGNTGAIIRATGSSVVTAAKKLISLLTEE